MALNAIKNFIKRNKYLESVIYMIMGMFLAVMIYQVLAYGLQTSNPIVTVVSYSMVPTLDKGDLVVLTGAAIDSLNAGKDGDIIVYQCPSSGSTCPSNRLIIHRLWDLNSDGSLKTWGDSNPEPDRWDVKPDMVTGKVLFKVPLLGYPRILLSEIIGR